MFRSSEPHLWLQILFLDEVSLKSVSSYQTFRSTLLNLKGQETQSIGRGTARPQRPTWFDLIKSQSVSQCYPVKDAKHPGKLDDALDKGGDYPPKSSKETDVFLSRHLYTASEDHKEGRKDDCGWGTSFPSTDFKKGYAYSSPAHRGIVLIPSEWENPEEVLHPSLYWGHSATCLLQCNILTESSQKTL